MALYIKEKRKMLREFGMPKWMIDCIPWERAKNEIQCDQIVRTALIRYLEKYE